MEKEILTVLNELKSSGVQISYWVYIWIALISLIFSGLGAYLSSYLRKKGAQAATKEDIEEIKNQLQQTTKAIETVKASISKDLHIEKSKWDLKKNIYTDLILNLTELRISTMAYQIFQENPEKKASSFEKMNTALQSLLKYKEVGGIFIDQPILDKMSQLPKIYRENKKPEDNTGKVWEEFIDAITDVIESLKLEAKKDLFG